MGLRYYPAFLDLRERLVLVVGGGAVAERKITSFLEAGARVRVVSPWLVESLRPFAAGDRIEYRCGEYTDTDMEGVDLVVSATDDPGVNQVVAADAARRRVFCNVVDVPSLCSFIVPAVIHRGDVVVAVSTSGSSPALTQRLKRVVSRSVGQKWAKAAGLLARWRPVIVERIQDQALRAEVFHRLAESEIVDLLDRDDEQAAERLAGEIVEEGARRGRGGAKGEPR